MVKLCSVRNLLDCLGRLKVTTNVPAKITSKARSKNEKGLSNIHRSYWQGPRHTPPFQCDWETIFLTSFSQRIHRDIQFNPEDVGSFYSEISILFYKMIRCQNAGCVLTSPWN
jgi:hypothetical protein